MSSSLSPVDTTLGSATLYRMKYVETFEIRAEISDEAADALLDIPVDGEFSSTDIKGPYKEELLEQGLISPALAAGRLMITIVGDAMAERVRDKRHKASIRLAQGFNSLTMDMIEFKDGRVSFPDYVVREPR